MNQQWMKWWVAGAMAVLPACEAAEDGEEDSDVPVDGGDFEQDAESDAGADADASCTTDEQCDDGEACSDGVCEPPATPCEDDADCEEGEGCVASACAAEPECADDTDCEVGETCTANVCVSACEVDDDCREDEVCTDEVCTEAAPDECAEATDCADGEVCVDGACESDSGGGAECDQDADCGDQLSCSAGACRVGDPVVSAGALQVSIVAPERFTVPGGRAVYLIDLFNASGARVEDVRTTFTVPESVRFSRSVGAVPTAACNASTCYAGREAAWIFDAIEAGSHETISIHGTVENDAALGATLTGGLRVQASGLSTVSVNKAIQVVESEARLQVAADDDSLAPGETTRIVVSLGNPGNTSITGVRASLVLDPGLRVTDASGEVATDGRSVTWEVGRLDAHVPLTRTVTVTAEDSFDGVNQMRAELVWEGMSGEPQVAEDRIRVEANPLQVSLETMEGVLTTAESAEYRFQVSNRSDARMENVEVFFPTPWELSFARGWEATRTASCNATTCYSFRTASWDLGNLEAGESVSFAVRASLGAGYVGGDLIAARVQAKAEGASAGAGHLAGVVESAASLLGVTADSGAPLAGDTVTATLVLGSRSGTLRDAELSFEALGAIEIDSGSDAAETAGANGLRWGLGEVTEGQTVERTVTLSVPEDAVPGAHFALHAYARHSAGPDTDRVASWSGVVAAQASPLTLDLEPAEAWVSFDGTLLYTVRVENVSDRSYDGLTVSQLVPNLTRFSRSTAAEPDAQCNATTCYGGRRAYWEIPTLAPGVTEIITFNASVDALVGDHLPVVVELEAEGLPNTQVRGVLSPVVD